MDERNACVVEYGTCSFFLSSRDCTLLVDLLDYIFLYMYFYFYLGACYKRSEPSSCSHGSGYTTQQPRCKFPRTQIYVLLIKKTL
jgi:hypothetical protein